MRVWCLWFGVGVGLMTTLPAMAQEPAPMPAPPPAQPLQPLPPSQPPPNQGLPAQPPPGYGPPPGGYYQQPPPGYGQQPPPGYGQPAPYYAPQPQPYYAPPPPPVYVAPPPAPEPTHAPKFSLWVGARAGVVGFGGGFYNNVLNQDETTGNFVGTGADLEADVGARLGKRYIPYVFWSHAILPAGHRFENGSSPTASSDYRGGGIRIIGGDVDTVGFMTDLSIGVRTISITNGGSNYTMTALEYFRLGLGAEIRITTLFALTPLVWISDGVMSDTTGAVSYAPGQGDGLSHPDYQNGQNIAGNSQKSYLALGINVGAHFDVFGK